MRHVLRFLWIFIAVLVFSCQAPPTQPSVDRHVVLISIDGLRPEFYLSDEYDTPNLKRLAKAGAYAKACVGVNPSVTYPNHASIVTGVEPARHGIISNTRFRPGEKGVEWYWDEKDFKAPTIWQMAKDKGLKVAIIYWPTSVGAQVDWLIPEQHSFVKLAQGTTPGLLEAIQKEYGLFNPEWEKDQARVDDFLARSVAHVFRHHQPHLTLLHLVQADKAQHTYGRDHEEVKKAVANVDQAIGSLVMPVEDSPLGGKVTWIITGDHGFSDVHTTLAPNVLLREAGLIEVKDDKLVDWKVMVHTSGTSGWIYARGDVEAGRRAAEILKKHQGKYWTVIPPPPSLVSQPSGRMILGAITAEKGYCLTSSFKGKFERPSDKQKGNHGFPTDWPEMHTGLILTGAGVKPGTVWEKASLLDIAPTVTHRLGLDMSGLEGKPLLR